MNQELESVKPVELVDFATGEVIDPADTPRVASYLKDLRRLKRETIDVLIGQLEEVLVAEAERQGSKTLRYGDTQVEVVESKEIVWDHEVLEQLRELGLPEERYAELVVPQVTYKVRANVAKQIAGVNDQYAKVIEAARSDMPGRRRVRVT